MGIVVASGLCMLRGHSSAHDQQCPQQPVGNRAGWEAVRYGSGQDELHNLWGSQESRNAVWPGAEEKQGAECDEENPVERENVEDKLQLCHLHITRRPPLNTVTNTATEDLRACAFPA